jgi:hypothetical protein
MVLYNVRTRVAYTVYSYAHCCVNSNTMVLSAYKPNISFRCTRTVRKPEAKLRAKEPSSPTPASYLGTPLRPRPFALLTKAALASTKMAAVRTRRNSTRFDGADALRVLTQPKADLDTARISDGATLCVTRLDMLVQSKVDVNKCSRNSGLALALVALRLLVGTKADAATAAFSAAERGYSEKPQVLMDDLDVVWLLWTSRRPADRHPCRQQPVRPTTPRKFDTSILRAFCSMSPSCLGGGSSTLHDCQWCAPTCVVARHNSFPIHQGNY